MKFIEFDKYIGNQLRAARVVRRISQEEMAKLISQKMKKQGYKKGIGRTGYAFYETGERSMPETIYSIACDILNLDEDLLFDQALNSIRRNKHAGL